MKYLIIIEKAETEYSAYSPDLSGGLLTGKRIGDTFILRQRGSHTG